MVSDYNSDHMAQSECCALRETILWVLFTAPTEEPGKYNDLIKTAQSKNKFPHINMNNQHISRLTEFHFIKSFYFKCIIWHKLVFIKHLHSTVQTYHKY